MTALCQQQALAIFTTAQWRFLPGTFWGAWPHGESCARAYNGALGAEPPSGSRGRAPGGGSGGRSPPEAETFVAFGRSLEAANLSTFLKFGNAKNHRYLCCRCKNEV